MSTRPSEYALTSPGPLRLYSTAELLKLPSPEWLIEPIIPAGGLVGLYGPPGVGKSFVAVDQAMSVAAGVYWQTCPTQEGYVIYISAEGGRGMGKRALAWCEYHDIPPRDLAMAWLVEPIPVYQDAVDTGDETVPYSRAMEQLLDRITEIDRTPALIVIDTLARCFDGNENEQEDMGRFIAGCDVLRHQFETTVLIVHHTRLAGDRERGNTAFRGAADTMIALSSEGDKLLVECNKQKDAEEFQPMRLRLEKVAATESCVSVLCNGQGRPRQVTESDLLVALGSDTITADEWRSRIPGISRATFYRVLARLKRQAVTDCEDGTYVRS